MARSWVEVMSSGTMSPPAPRLWVRAMLSGMWDWSILSFKRVLACCELPDCKPIKAPRSNKSNSQQNGVQLLF